MAEQVIYVHNIVATLNITYKYINNSLYPTKEWSHNKKVTIPIQGVHLPMSHSLKKTVQRDSDPEMDPCSFTLGDKAAKTALMERRLLKQSGNKTPKLKWVSLQKLALKKI